MGKDGVDFGGELPPKFPQVPDKAPSIREMPQNPTKPLIPNPEAVLRAKDPQAQGQVH